MKDFVSEQLDKFKGRKKLYEEKHPREFRGIWIPKEVWENKELNIQEKSLWAEIDSLDLEKKGCFASNKYFAKFFSLSEKQISDYIGSLKKKGYIYQKSFNGRFRVIHSNLKMKKQSRGKPLGRVERNE